MEAHRESVAGLVKEHNRALHAFLMARVGDEHEAREVAQEAYVRMLQLDQPGAISYLRAYLFKMAANIAIDRARERAGRARILQAEFAEEVVDELSPDRYALSAEEVRVLQQALSELPPRYQEAFRLFHVQGLRDEAIGAQLGVGPRQVRRYLAESNVYCQLRIKGVAAAQAAGMALR